VKKQIAKPKTRPWPVKFLKAEEAIWCYDEFLRDKMPDVINRIANQTKLRIEEQNAMGCFHKLCKAGCHHTDLLYLLGTCENRGVQSTVKLTGYDSEELTIKLKMIRECAQTLEEINTREFGLFIKDRRHFKQHDRLAVTLRQYAGLVDHAARHLGGKTDFYLHVAKGRLIHYVREKTGAYHDKEVAETLAAVLDSAYSESDHRGWRNTYHKRISDYTREAGDTPALRAKKTRLEMRAATLYRSDTIRNTAPIRKANKSAAQSAPNVEK
jgi:hypothetical protein